MESKTLFYEKQQFRQWWLWLLFLAIFGYIFFKIIIQKDYGNTKNWYEFLFLLIPIALVFMFYIMKMETTIKEDGIYIRLYPLLLKTKFYPIETIKTIEVKKYNALMEYGGWGIRMGAYNVSGNQGFQMTFKNGNKILIGTQKQEEIKQVLNQLNYDQKTA